MTILGKHTIQELADLVNDSSWQIGDLQRAYERIKNPVTDPGLPIDWALFLKRWDEAKSEAKAYITAAGFLSGATGFHPAASPDVVPAEETYQKVLRALNVHYPGAYDERDLAGLRQRIAKFVDIPQSPRPKGSALDIDLKGYEVANKGAEGVKQIEKKAEDETKDWAADNWGKIAVGGVAAIGTLVVLKKVGLL